MPTQCQSAKSLWTWRPLGPRKKACRIFIWDPATNVAVSTKAVSKDFNGGPAPNGARIEKDMWLCVKEIVN